jgi:hypothetical protein
MGKTVESYRMALELEINRWNGFARALLNDEILVCSTTMNLNLPAKLKGDVVVRSDFACTTSTRLVLNRKDRCDFLGEEGKNVRKTTIPFSFRPKLTAISIANGPKLDQIRKTCPTITFHCPHPHVFSEVNSAEVTETLQ